MPLRVITFDLDNTLWDVEPALLRAEEAQRLWLLEHRPGSVEHLDHRGLWDYKKRLWAAHPELAHNVSAMRRTLLCALQQDAGYGAEEARRGADEAFAVFLAERQKVELYSEALEVLEHLAGRYRLGALTNGNADVYKTDAGEYFDFAFLAEDFPASKPAPHIFEAALAKTRARADEVAHVGDNPDHDVRGARRVGMRAVWLNANGDPWPETDTTPSSGRRDTGALVATNGDPGEARSETSVKPDAVIRSLRELPEAIARLELAWRRAHPS